MTEPYAKSDKEPKGACGSGSVERGKPKAAGQGHDPGFAKEKSDGDTCVRVRESENPGSTQEAPNGHPGDHQETTRICFCP